MSALQIKVQPHIKRLTLERARLWYILQIIIIHSSVHLLISLN